MMVHSSKYYYLINHPNITQIGIFGLAAADAVQVDSRHAQPRQHSQLEIEHPLLNSITVLIHLYLSISDTLPKFLQKADP